MIDQLLRTFLPVMLRQVAVMPMQQKRHHAAHMLALLEAFLENRQDDFELLISGFGSPDPIQKQAIEALFRDENKTG